MLVDDVAWKPLHPEPFDQGDPLVLKIPDRVPAQFRYFMFTTGFGGREERGRAFPVYGSDDLISWTRFPDNALIADPSKDHWAPCVYYVGGADRPYVMLYSHGIGTGEEGHIGHRILRADAGEPQGPYRPSGQVLTPGFDFAIDADVWRAPNGALRCAFAADFVDREPYGTGLFMASIAEDLTAFTEAPAPLLRPSAPWQLFDAARRMPWKQIAGVDWSRGDTVRWSCVEGPCGLVLPDGREMVIYSGGNFADRYACGAMIERDGRFVDVSGGDRFVLAPAPELGVLSTGHLSTTIAPDGRRVLIFHGRTREGGPRQAMLSFVDYVDELGLVARRPKR
jgi:hypothetical protein